MRRSILTGSTLAGLVALTGAGCGIMDGTGKMTLGLSGPGGLAAMFQPLPDVTRAELKLSKSSLQAGESLTITTALFKADGKTASGTPTLVVDPPAAGTINNGKFTPAADFAGSVTIRAKAGDRTLGSQSLTVFGPASTYFLDTDSRSQPVMQNATIYFSLGAKDAKGNILPGAFRDAAEFGKVLWSVSPAGFGTFPESSGTMKGFKPTQTGKATVTATLPDGKTLTTAVIVYGTEAAAGEYMVPASVWLRNASLGGTAGGTAVAPGGSVSLLLGANNLVLEARDSAGKPLTGDVAFLDELLWETTTGTQATGGLNGNTGKSVSYFLNPPTSVGTIRTSWRVSVGSRRYEFNGQFQLVPGSTPASGTPASPIPTPTPSTPASTAPGNQGPTITAVTPSTPTVVPGAGTRLDVAASDPENDRIRYFWDISNLTSGSVSVDTRTGTLSWQTDETTAAGTYVATVFVSDETHVRSASRQVTITVGKE
jgi:hypothetical protein